MIYRLRTSRRAGRHIREAAAWWAVHRDKAPRAFAEDLADAFQLVSEFPRAGEAVSHSRTAGIRRILLARTGYHLYYLVDGSAMTVELLALWHGQRGGGPSF